MLQLDVDMLCALKAIARQLEIANKLKALELKSGNAVSLAIVDDIVEDYQ